MAKGDEKRSQQAINYNSTTQSFQQQQASNLMYGAPPGNNQQGGPQGGQNFQEIFNRMFPGDTLSHDDLLAKEGELNAQGIKVLRNAKGRAGKIQLPDGRIIDVVQGGESGLNKKQWLGPDEDGGGAGQQGGAAGQALRDYSDIQGKYGDVMDKYGEFAKTGGFSPEDLANIRARSSSGIRSVYSSAQQGLNRQKALQGGYSPNYTAATAKMAREQSQGVSDASRNTEAGIAEMVQRGRLAGIGGMGNTVGGMAGMYGSTPGLANMFGNQALGQQQVGLGLIGQQINKSQQPSNYDIIMNRVGQGANMASSIAGAFG